MPGKIDYQQKMTTVGIIEKKRLSAIVFFARKGNRYTIDRYKLMKLLWLSDRIHLNRYGRMILYDTYNALLYGPEPATTVDYSKATHEDFYTVEGVFITATSEADLHYFSKSDINVMEEVWEKYGKLDPIEFRNFSHKFPEWIRYRTQLLDRDLPNCFKMNIADFFLPPESNADYEYNAELSRLSRNEYYIHTSIQGFLDR